MSYAFSSFMTDTAPPGRRARKRAQTLDHIAATAAQLFDRDGFAAVTMEQIAAAADVAKATLYNHFPTKEAVLAHSVHRTLGLDTERLLADLRRARSFRTRLARLLEASARWCEANRDRLGPYLRHRFLCADFAAPPAGDDPQDFIALFALLIAEAQRAGELRSDIGHTQLAQLLHHLYFGALVRWLPSAEASPRHEFAAIATLFIDGAAPRSKA